MTRALDDRPVVHCRTRKNGEQSCRRGRCTVFANRQIEFGAGEPDFRRYEAKERARLENRTRFRHDDAAVIKGEGNVIGQKREVHRRHPELETHIAYRDRRPAKTVTETRLENALQATGAREIDCRRCHRHCENEQQRDEYITP